MDAIKKMASDSSKVFSPNKNNPRLMKYPYTLGAQIAQFPYKFYFQNQPVFRYWIYGCIVSFPVFMWINGMANSPANKAKWAEIRRKEAEEHH